MNSESIFHQIQDFFKNKSIQIANKCLNSLLLEFSFYYISEIHQNDATILNFTAKSDIIIDEYINDKSEIKIFHDFLIICFDNVLINLDRSKYYQLHQFLLKNKGSNIYFVSKTTEENVRQIIKTSQADEGFTFMQVNDFSGLIQKSYGKMKNEFNLKIKNSNLKKSNEIKAFWSIIQPSISYLFLIKSFNNSKIDRIHHYDSFFKKDDDKNEIKIHENEYIKLFYIGNGSTSSVYVIYHVPSERIFVQKIFFNLESTKDLRNVEEINYLNIKHPLFPRYYGRLNEYDYKCLIIQYIEGKNLLDMSKLNLNFNDKIKIIFQIMIVIEYLHFNNLIYRDLKPDNIMIDKNKTSYLLDFNKMIKSPNSIDETMTFNLSSSFTAPEIIHFKRYTNKVDIYSLGLMIEYILSQEERNKVINEIINDCKSEEPFKRPTISELIEIFYSEFFSKISPITVLNTIQTVENIHTEKFFPFWFLISEYQNAEAQYQLGQIYLKGKLFQKDLNKAIQFFIESSKSNHLKALTKLGKIYSEQQINIGKAVYYLTMAANQNYKKAEHILGKLFYEGKYIKPDINKAIFYLSLAAEQNDSESQNLLGIIYLEGKYIEVDIDKAIHYFTLASNQNNSYSQVYLGAIYLLGKYVKRDIDLAIYYFTLAANQNDSYAQSFLGYIYSVNNYARKDINKAIYYYSLAANQNEPAAQTKLGIFYYEGEYFKKDINKAIHYFTLASNQNDPIAQYILGNIYYFGKYANRDIYKAIHYHTQAADRNIIESQLILGIIYFDGKFIQPDINKAFHYHALAANQNHPNAQVFLGINYLIGKYVQRDIDKAIHYLTLAANQNEFHSQYYLGTLYYENKFVQRNMNKAIHYLTLAANQNDPKAQINLGNIYYKGEFVRRDINKAIDYYTRAASKNNPTAQTNLGIIYSEGIYIKKDINKAIHYFTLAANQNSVKAQSELGNIYYYSKGINHDINKAVHYLTLAANSNNSVCQFNLGLIYYEGTQVPFDFNKSIYYFTLSANQNDSQAQTWLGYIYINRKGIEPDIKKALYYFNLAANQNNTDAQCNLGLLYYDNKHIARDISKSIYYLTLAANKSNKIAQYYLGVIYYKFKKDSEKCIHYLTLSANQSYTEAERMLGYLYYLKINDYKQDIKKSIYYFANAAKKDDFVSNFSLGVIYLEGQFISRDYDKSIRYFKNASSFNCQNSKNNLGVIMKRIKNNTAFAIELFNEAINHKNDLLSMFNLAHIYFYDELNFEKSIDLLIKSSKNNFDPSKILLSLIMVKKISSINFNSIELEMKKYGCNDVKLIQEILYIIEENDFKNKNIYENIYSAYKDKNYIYNFIGGIELFSVFISKKDLTKKSIEKYIDENFYNGFYLGKHNYVSNYVKNKSFHK